MARYYFNIRNGDKLIRDNRGVELANVRAALPYAEIFADEVRADQSWGNIAGSEA